MTHRSYLYILSFTLFLCAMIIIIGFMISYSRKSESKGLSQSEASAISFVLKEYNGKLGLFRGQAQSPYQTLDFDITYLSEYDRELLKEGISVDTEPELEMLIEDYTG